MCVCVSNWVNGGTFVQHGDFVNNTKHVHSVHLSCKSVKSFQMCGYNEDILLALQRNTHTYNNAYNNTSW